MEELFAAKLKPQLETFIAEIQGLKTDILGIGKEFYMKYYGDWKKIREVWDDEYFADAEFTVDVKCGVAQSGQIYNRIKEK
jgi:spore germination protein KC